MMTKLAYWMFIAFNIVLSLLIVAAKVAYDRGVEDTYQKLGWHKAEDTPDD